MKTAYIIHGWDGSPKELMLAWLRDELVKKGYDVSVPAMPNPGEPEVGAWVGKLTEIVKPAADTLLVGHSVGGQAVLRWLEALPKGTKVGNVVLIAPWMELDEETIKEEGEEVREIARPWMETPIDFGKVKAHARKFTAIFSDNDPFVPLSQQEVFKRELGAKIVVEHEKGHFDPASGIKELPSALEGTAE